MNQQLLEVLLGFARHGLTGLGGILVASGYASTDQVTQAVTATLGVISFAAGLVWSWWQKRQAAAKLVSVAAASAATGQMQVKP